MKTTIFINGDTVQRDWLHVNADGKTLGRLASEIAFRLRGKHKPEYTPNADAGDYIIVTNVEKIRVTGNKLKAKTYWRHTEYPGGIKSTTLDKVLQTHPERALLHAVKGMLPRGPLGYAQLRKLKVYVGPEHPHAAQQPIVLDIET